LPYCFKLVLLLRSGVCFIALNLQYLLTNIYTEVTFGVEILLNFDSRSIFLIYVLFYVLSQVFPSFFLSFLLSFLIWPLLPIHCSCVGSLLYLITFNDAHKHNWQDSPGRGIYPWEIPVTVQHATSQEASIHAPGGIRTHNPSKQASADLDLRPCEHRERPSQKSQAENHHLPNISQKYYLLNKTCRIFVLIT
jgi:hypothetical protein